MTKSAFELLNNYISISHETFDKLSAYHDLLLKWQSKINLISNDTIKDVWRRHFLDSLQLLSYIDNKEKAIVDLGSGAGFPAMALAIAGFQNVHLVESDIRKSAFLREVARITETKATIHNCRIEEIKIEKIDIVTSRACASLDKLLHLVYDKISHETICLFHKGKNYSMECEEASKNWQYDISVTPSIVDSEGVIVKISNLHKR
jgi:16S rRNA (guanine527-N7)-methyltransferase